MMHTMSLMTTSLDHTLELLNDNVIQTTPIYFGEWEFFFDSRYHLSPARPYSKTLITHGELFEKWDRDGIKWDKASR